MTIRVTTEVIDALLSEAEAAHPLECCGILLGDTGAVRAIVPARNVHPQPETHFEIDPQALVDAHRVARRGGPQVIGYFHSHPNGLARPSASDEASSSGDGSIWAIIGGRQVTFWRDAKDGFQRLSMACDTR